jgi:hypothetical protein
MGLWQIIDQNRDGIFVPAPSLYDDGETKRPNDAGFSLASVIAYAAGRMFNFMGVPNWRAA